MCTKTHRSVVQFYLSLNKNMVIKKFKKRLVKKVKRATFCNIYLTIFKLLVDVNYFIFAFMFGVYVLETFVGGVYVLHEFFWGDCSSDYFFFESPKHKEAFAALAASAKPLILSPSENSAFADFSQSVKPLILSQNSAFADFSQPVKPLTEISFFVEVPEITTPLQDEISKAYDDFTRLIQIGNAAEIFAAQDRLAELLKRSGGKKMQKDADKKMPLYNYVMIVLYVVVVFLC